MSFLMSNILTSCWHDSTLKGAAEGKRKHNIDRGGASRAGESHQRRSAIAGHPAIPKNDEGPAAVHSSLERIEEERSGGGSGLRSEESGKGKREKITRRRIGRKGSAE